MSGRSSAGAVGGPDHPTHGTQLRTVRPDGTPVYRYQQRPGMPPIGVVGFDHAMPQPPPGHRHAHDFLVLVYVESGRGSARMGGRDRPLRAGAVYAVPPGQVLGSADGGMLLGCRAWATFFMPEALPDVVAGSPLRWAGHPLLAIFAPGWSAPGPLTVPPAERRDWSRRFAELAAEVAEPARVAAGAAATAALTRLLVAAARLARTAGQDPAIDPVVCQVFEVIEERFRDPISTRDVAAALGYTPEHLTTTVRERTGRTVLDWITERRMGEVRRLLAETDLPVRTIALQTGHRDGDYLTRRFRERYGTTPLRWRRDR